jgi:hypothetical protein
VDVQRGSVNPDALFAFHAVSFTFLLMETTAAIQCPFCGQSFELSIDTSISSQRFTTDCEVCCRPFEVFAECEPGTILSLETNN